MTSKNILWETACILVWNIVQFSYNSFSFLPDQSEICLAGYWQVEYFMCLCLMPSILSEIAIRKQIKAAKIQVHKDDT